MKIDIIILSNTINSKIYDLNNECINSLIVSENADLLGDIILIESNKNATYTYPDIVEVIIPADNFNYNRYINIGIKATSSQFIGICNNDIIFYRNWFSEILKIKSAYPEVLSFCPLDPYNKRKELDRYIKYGDFYLGYNVGSEIAGWCIVIDRILVNIIGKFDEKFDFYYSDNDYAMTLIKHGIRHALVTRSIVRHLGGMNTSEARNELLSKCNIKYKRFPKDLKKSENNWIIQNPRMLDGYIIFHKKWGGNLSIIRRIAVQNRLSFLKERRFSRIMYSSIINYICSSRIRLFGSWWEKNFNYR